MKFNIKNKIMKLRNYEEKIKKEISAFDVIVIILFILSIDKERQLTYWSKYFNYFYDYFPLIVLIAIEINYLNDIFKLEYDNSKENNEIESSEKELLMFEFKLFVMIIILIIHIMYRFYGII